MYCVSVADSTKQNLEWLLNEYIQLANTVENDRGGFSGSRKAMEKDVDKATKTIQYILRQCD